MKKQYHILNGDSLKDQFPEKITGEIIIARECLVDGNVKGDNLKEFFHSRAEFISSYDNYSVQDYYDKTVPEIQKMLDIIDNAEVNLWFEDDLFCQVNFWFVLSLLFNSTSNNSIYLIRPKAHNQYGFGGLNELELQLVYEERTLLTSLDKLSGLWKYYQNEDFDNLLKTASELESEYPFILTAVKAHLDRIPSKGNLGRPSESLIQIMKDLNTDQFNLVFREFCKRESIYGFGDLQVKRLFDNIIKNH